MDPRSSTVLGQAQATQDRFHVPVVDNRGRPVSVYRSPIYKSYPDQTRSVLDRQAGTVLVERRYDHYPPSVVYRDTPRSPPRPHRVLDIRNPFEEQYARRAPSSLHKQKAQAHLPEAVHRTHASSRDLRQTSISNEVSHDRAEAVDALSLHPDARDPLYREIEEDSRSLTKDTRTTIASPSHDQTDYQSDNESQSSEIVPDTWSMEKATNEVFRILPEKLCPRLPSVPKHVNRSGLEELNNEETLEVNLLPQANIVQTMMAQLQQSRSLEACSSNWTVPSNINREYMASRVYNSYAVSQEHLPVKPPTLDPEAQAIGMTIPNQVIVPTKTLERWEARSRMATNIASHSDHFIATLDRLLKDEKVSSVAVNRIMSALDKSKTKILGLSLHNATEMLTTRRDATLDFKSTSLLKGSKDVLRATPLSSKTLFNGKVKDVTASDLAEQTRLCSAQLMRGGTKRPAPPSNSKPKNKKAKVVQHVAQQPKQGFTKPYAPKKQQRSYGQQQRPKPQTYKAAPAVPKARP